jgi:hypothetical protein
MRVTLRASSGIRILVWREDQEFHARRVDAADRTQICLGVDLFEVIAELAELDLESEGGAAEATKLADEARRRLASTRTDDPDNERSEPGAAGPPLGTTGARRRRP